MGILKILLKGWNMKKLSLSKSMVIGSLLFGMLFGAGNIIFPISMGQLSGAHFLPAGLGFLVTAVGLPVLAVISYALSKKNSLIEYASPAGKGFAMFFGLALLITIGPLFATPRTATVAFEVAFAPHIENNQEIFLFIYSFIFFGLVLFFSLRPSRIVESVGKYMAPIFFVLISILMFANILNPMGSPIENAAQAPYDKIPFIQGMLDGYSTMDVLACIAFAGTIIFNLKKMGVSGNKNIALETGRSSITTLVLMSILYICFAYFGSSSVSLLGLQKNGGRVLALGSAHFFGSFGYALLATTISLACLKTSIGLAVSISASMNDIFPNKMSLKKWTISFVILSFLVANFGLDKLISLSLPVLMFLYPLAIALIFLWWINAAFKLDDKAFKLTLWLATIPAFFDFLKACPDFIKNTGLVQKLLGFAKNYIPFFRHGIGWLIPVGVCLLISLLLFREKR